MSILLRILLYKVLSAIVKTGVFPVCAYYGTTADKQERGQKMLSYKPNNFKRVSLFELSKADF